MSKLSEGLIRIVGRYWENGKKFKGMLKANYKGKSSSIIITVKKPISLGNTPNAATIDVFGNDQDINSMIIKFAGEYGIPPQILKADINHESSFNPGYRWEPFVDASMQRNEKRYISSNFRYRISANPNSEGQPGIPTNHTNVHPIQYPRDDYRSIWDRFFDESRTLNPNASVNRYPKSLWYQAPSRNWQIRYDKKFKDLIRQGKTNTQSQNEARDFANYYLKNEYLQGIMSNGIVQTRTAASYGLMQILYISAVRYRNYPFDTYEESGNHLPEYLNVADTNLTYSVPFLLSKIQRELITEGDGNNKPNEWALGFENTFVYSLNMYNGITNTEATETNPNTRYNWHYGFEVLNLLYLYLPEN
jgi:hypothetical protein